MFYTLQILLSSNDIPAAFELGLRIVKVRFLFLSFVNLFTLLTAKKKQVQKFDFN
jgi:hypothetical protein